MSENNILSQLIKVIEDRRDNPINNSYTDYLFEKGLDKILKKVGEESAEVIIAAKNGSKSEMVLEISDLVYHILVLMVQNKVEICDIENELEKRQQKICNKKPERFDMSGIH